MAPSAERIARAATADPRQPRATTPWDRRDASRAPAPDARAPAIRVSGVAATRGPIAGTDLQDPTTWVMDQDDKNDVAGRCLRGLRANGIPATRVALDPTKLKGGYICDTMRVQIFYEADKKTSPKGGAGKTARGWVAERPATAILKIASPGSADHDVAMRLHLYEREWHFYEHLSHRVPIRVPRSALRRRALSLGRPGAAATPRPCRPVAF